MNNLFFPFLSILGNSVGDFYIYKSIKSIGVEFTLFFICSTSILFTPFVYSQLILLSRSEILSLFFTSSLTMISALLFYKALSSGKLSVMESVLSLELPIILILNLFLYKEHISNIQVILVLALFFGIFLTVTKRKFFFKRIFQLEKGTLYALILLTACSLTTFFSGTSAKTISPLLTFWFTHFFMFMCMLLFIVFSHNTKSIKINFQNKYKLILILCIFDTMGWIGFLYSNNIFSVSVSSALREAYVPIVIFCGYYFNKEKLSKHQIIGLAIASLSVITLSYISS